MPDYAKIEKALGAKAEFLLGHKCQTISSSGLHLPGPDFIDRVFLASNRSPRVLGSLSALYGSGRL
ncbi:MAG: fructose-bisphosphate aldolase, partial [Leptolyngbya sp.]|nr:fructose-bisphosphate aldolase [Candidatus Melainabacteria bacterium]